MKKGSLPFYKFLTIFINLSRYYVVTLNVFFICVYFIIEYIGRLGDPQVKAMLDYPVERSAGNLSRRAKPARGEGSRGG